jgi:hypothetical protein
MIPKVFLSGAIEGVEQYGVNWRKEATHLLHLAGYDVLDPTTIVEGIYDSPQEIVDKNLFMQKRADIILVEYMIPNRPYIGTDFELAWAKFNGQPAVVFSCYENLNRVYLKYMATKVTTTMEEAVDYISINYPSNFI